MLEGGPLPALNRQPHRPLCRAVLRDDLSLRRRLHASGRSRAGTTSRRPTRGRWLDRVLRGAARRRCCRGRACSALAVLGWSPSRWRGRCGAAASRRRTCRRRLQAMLDLAPAALPDAVAGRPAADLSAPRASAAARVALLHRLRASRCWRPQINEATVRLLTRHGVEVVIVAGVGLLRRARPTTSGEHGAAIALRPAPTSTPGRARSTARGSTPS